MKVRSDVVICGGKNYRGDYMSQVTLFSRPNTFSSEVISSPLEMKMAIKILQTENAELKEKLKMLTDIIAPLMKQKI